MRTRKILSTLVILFCFATNSTFAKTSSKYNKSSKSRYTKHRANKAQGPMVEEIPQEIFPQGHKFTPEEKTQASEIGAMVQNGMWKEAFRATTRATKEHPERWWLQAARAVAASNLNRSKDVIRAVDSAIQTNGGDANPLNVAQLYTLRANALSRLGRKKEAMDNFVKGIQLTKTDPYCRAGAAWLLATANEPSIRNGANAVTLAREAAKLSHWKDDTVLDVLAAAYAETGDFPSAQKWEGKAILLGSPRDVPYYQHRLMNYQAGKPWRESLN